MDRGERKTKQQKNSRNLLPSRWCLLLFFGGLTSNTCACLYSARRCSSAHPDLLNVVVGMHFSTAIFGMKEGNFVHLFSVFFFCDKIFLWFLLERIWQHRSRITQIVHDFSDNQKNENGKRTNKDFWLGSVLHAYRRRALHIWCLLIDSMLLLPTYLILSFFSLSRISDWQTSSTTTCRSLLNYLCIAFSGGSE